MIDNGDVEDNFLRSASSARQKELSPSHSPSPLPSCLLPHLDASSGGESVCRADLRNSLLQLDEERKRIEAEIAELNELLNVEIGC